MRGTAVVSGMGIVVSMAGLAALSRPGEPASKPASQLVEVVAGDYFFRAPEVVAAGRTRIRLVNQGSEFHHLQLLRFDGDHSIQEVMTAMAKPELDLPWITMIGGPSTPPPNGASEVEMLLRPGRYAMVCFVTTKDGVRHLMKGMIRQLTVTGATADTSVTRPSGEVTITLSDYDFAMSRPLAAGRQRILVENRGPQSHEVGFWVLAPGATEESVREWLRKPNGPPPAFPAGGVMDLSPGEVNVAVVDLPVGKILLECFVPDRTDGKPHLTHGMIRFVDVR